MSNIEDLFAYDSGAQKIRALPYQVFSGISTMEKIIGRGNTLAFHLSDEVKTFHKIYTKRQCYQTLFITDAK